MASERPIPVIDIFAGPGGLGEGFARLRSKGGSGKAFKTAISIEKDPAAHRTLTLRAFYRQIQSKPKALQSYFNRLRDPAATTAALYELFPSEAAKAMEESWLAELASEQCPVPLVRERVKKALAGAGDWVLLGGPPCQAYSLAGRSRNRGIAGYSFEQDAKTTLYLEYLQLIADFWPSVFVMENVKGLLSAQHSGGSMFGRICDDLTDPAKAIKGIDGRDQLERGRRHRYRLFPAVQSGALLDGFGSTDPRDFVVHAEKFGIPQARHRVIIIGVREDFTDRRPEPLKPWFDPGNPDKNRVSVRDVIGDLPPLRSGLSTKETAEHWAETLGRLAGKTWRQNLSRGGKGDVANRAAEIAEQAKDLSTRLPRSATGVEVIPGIAYQRQWYEADRMTSIANHESRTHMASDLLRYLFASSFAEVKGQSPELSDFPAELLPDHKNAWRALEGSHFADRFRVQRFDQPATTITSHISRDGHYYIHPDPTQCRSLTVREAARIQTFPDTYFFEGNRTAQYVQVGNAVPPLLAHQIAERVYDLFR